MGGTLTQDKSGNIPPAGSGLRGFLVLGSILAVFATLPFIDPPRIVIQLVTTNEEIEAVTFDDALSKAIDFRMDLSKTLFQTTLVILGALWSLVLAKKDEAKIVFQDAASITVFVCANLVLFFAGMSHIDFVMDISSVLAAAGAKGNNVPDVGAAYVSASLLSQLFRVFCAVLVSACALLGAKWK